MINTFTPSQAPAAGPIFTQPSRSLTDQLAALLTPPAQQSTGGGGSPFSLADMMAISKMMGGGEKPLPKGSIVGADAPMLPQGAGASYAVA
jgi:hypothetical protein